MPPVVYVGPQERGLAFERAVTGSVLAVETPDERVLDDPRTSFVVVDAVGEVDATRLADAPVTVLAAETSDLPDGVVDERVAVDGDPTAALADHVDTLADGSLETVDEQGELRRQSERLDTLTSSISHDLQTPIQLAITQLELYRETGDETHLDRLADAHERMQRLIDDLLTLARQGDTVDEPQRVSLASVCEDAWRGIDTGGARLRVRADATLTTTPGRLDRLLSNLFVNAVDHATDDVTVTVGLLPDGDGFYVADDGDGIGPADRDRIFERGYTTSDEGTGFGLAIVAEIVDAHGWSIAVTDQQSAGEPSGTRFEVSGISSLEDA
ncbi:sensor histidine kinase [Halomicrobium sp. HM KBTZ05]|uniref:histidine kinase n=1 Tax=Halomicrobium mukohataei TaxID=57705 RepID=A0A847U8I0_9EURY|nr:HAMP domain-containing sensor histidine kinase [Halomicrobium mukohataei]NLV09289.1 sensor histidine kinase [Halomicrobium mukohataei]